MINAKDRLIKDLRDSICKLLDTVDEKDKRIKLLEWTVLTLLFTWAVIIILLLRFTP